MIKLIDLISELDRPENIYSPGVNPEEPSDDFLQRGFRMKGTSINPITGASMSDVEYLPEFDKIKMDIGRFAKTFRTYKFSTDPDIASVATKLVTALNKADQLTTVLKEMTKNRK
jgi:hypothetical protein